jgi:hypothetical protein
MKPISFAHSNTTFGTNQPQYKPLPAHVDKDGIVTTCWTLNFWERLCVLFGSPVYISQMTFHQALQPQLVRLDFYPEEPR